MTDTYLICDKHGDVFVHRNAGPGAVALAAEMEPLRDDVEQPQAHHEIRCPLCQLSLRFEHRPSA